MYKELKNPCKEMLEKGLCLGCNRLENFEFEGDENCEYVRSVKNTRICDIKPDSNINNYDITLFNN